MNKGLRYILVVFLFLLLILIRAFAADLFYDPLILFFKTTHTTQVLPQFEFWKLIGATSLRFFTNTIISLFILLLLFSKSDVLKFSLVLYIAIYVMLILAFSMLLHSSTEGGHLALFYVRRFLIQPIFLLLLIPAFYFQKRR